jgi:hypothetical protein
VKKLSVIGLSIVAFILFAAPTAVEYSPVFLNGKPLGKAAVIDGVIAISVESFARAAGGTVTLEQAGFRLQGNTLLAGIIGEEGLSMKHKNAIIGEDSIKIKTVQASAVPEVAHKDQVAIKMKPNAAFRIAKGGAISRGVFMHEGKAWVPLSDVAKAFGDVLTVNAGTLKPGEPIRLNFSTNPNAILVGL